MSQIVKTLSILILPFLAFLAFYVADYGEKWGSYTIGLVAPLSGESSRYGHEMVAGAELAFEEIRARDLLEHVDLKLEIIDDLSTPTAQYRPQQAARKMLDTYNPLAVIGHYHSSASLSAQSIYHDAKTPVISPSSTSNKLTKDSSWAFTTIFDNAHQAEYMVNYALAELDATKVAVVYSDTSYGKSLRNFIERSLAKQGALSKTEVSFIDEGEISSGGNLGHLRKIREADVVLLAAHYDTAARLISLLKRAGVRSSFIGPESLGKAGFIEEAGIYAEGVYAITPFQESLLGNEARQFVARYEARFNEKPSWLVVYTYDTVMVLVEAINVVGADRTQIRNFLLSRDSKKRSFSGLAGDMLFDRKGACLRSIFMGQVKQGKFVAARSQFGYVNHQKYFKSKEAGMPIFKLHDLPVAKREVVFVGIKVHKIHRLETISGRFTAEFTFWMHEDRAGKKPIEFELVDGVILEQKEEETYYDESSGVRYRAYTITADFKDNFPLNDYPMDVQTVRIQIVPKGKSVEEIIFVTEGAGALEDGYLGFGSWSHIGQISYVQLREHTVTYENPLFDGVMYTLEQSVFSHDIELARDAGQYLLKFMPLIILLLIGGAVQLVPRSFIGGRLSLIVFLLLSVISRHTSHRAELAGIGYVVRTDKFFMAAYVIVFVAIGLNIWVARFVHREDDAGAHRIDRYGFAVYPTVVVGAFVAAYWH